MPPLEPAIHTDAGLLKLSDFQKKVRDLELALIDTKAQAERQFTALKESLFSKLERDLTNMQSKQASIDRTNINNF